MNFFKQITLISVFTVLGVPMAQAEDVTTLPTIKIMAESELREEVGFVPFQEDKPVRQALQHRIYKMDTDLQNAGVTELKTTVDYQPQAAVPDPSELSPLLQHYNIFAVAEGFLSADPTNGLFKMLQPLNITRENVNAIRDGSIKINFDEIIRLQQQIRNELGSR